MRPFSILLALAFVCPAEAFAQIPLLDQIFSKASDVNTSVGFGRYWSHRDSLGGAPRTISFEVSLLVGHLWCRDTSSFRDNSNDLCKRKHKDDVDDARNVDACAHGVAITGVDCDSVKVANRVEKADGWKETNREVERVGGAKDSTVTIKSSASQATRRTTDAADVEIGLSYGIVTGFRDRASSNYKFAGSIIELPVIATYLDLYPDNRISPFVGLEAGLAHLDGGQAYDGTNKTMYTATAATYLLGGELGVALRLIPRVYVLLGADANYLDFPSITWAPSNSSASTIPGDLRRRLNISNYSLYGGMQIALGGKGHQAQ